jgi:hypothetical protein
MADELHTDALDTLEFRKCFGNPPNPSLLLDREQFLLTYSDSSVSTELWKIKMSIVCSVCPVATVVGKFNFKFF